MKEPINAPNRASIEALGTDLNQYQRLATATAVYPGKGSMMGLWYCVTKLNGEAGECAEHIGKAFRDDDAIEVGDADFHGDVTIKINGLTPRRKEDMVKEVGDCLWHLSSICNELGITLQEAAETNLFKLLDRYERGVLNGEGDRR